VFAENSNKQSVFVDVKSSDKDVYVYDKMMVIQKYLWWNEKVNIFLCVIFIFGVCFCDMCFYGIFF